MFERAGQETKATIKFGVYSKKELDKLGEKRSVVHYFQYVFNSILIDDYIKKVINFTEEILPDQIMILKHKDLYRNECSISFEEKKNDFDKNEYEAFKLDKDLYSPSCFFFWENIKN